MAYTTKIRLKKRNKNIKNRIYSSNSWRKHTLGSAKQKFSRFNLSRYKRIFYFAGGVLLIFLFVGLIYGFSYIQTLQERLPTIDKPFGQKANATELYDKNGTLLYRVYGDEDRDTVKIDEVPFLLKWALLSAEDKDFYKHGGVDILGIIRCGFRNITGTGVSCGASTIDQQLLKLTALYGFNKYERKIAEAIMAVQMEKQYSKDQILEMYLTVVPEGSNIYGVTRGAKVYFGKDLKDLNLAELAILAAIPNSPNQYSPRNADGQENVKARQMYVLDAMEKNIDNINNNYKESTGKSEDILTKEMIDEAKNFELVYQKFSDKDKLKAPHFVFYVEKLLQQRGYNNGVPFTMEELETSGLKIYTTLDMDYQEIAEEQVSIGVNTYGKTYGADNAALIALDPTNGEILAMVGSKDYWAEEIPKGCVAQSCRFSGKVNILDTLQSYGSTMKPMIYYMSYMRGLVTPGSIIPDVPIKIGNYQPKNYEGGFYGMKSARTMLSFSRNIPAIYLTNQMGVDNVVAEFKKWGYTTFDNANGYGPSISVGGGDVKLIEHAQGYAVLANGGNYIQHEAIKKIVDRDGNIIYEHKADPVQVADPRGLFMVSDVLNARKGGPGSTGMNRDVAGKTGTSENAKETLFATYTPEIVVVGWLGNNNNDPLKSANGNASAKPWISGFYKKIEPTLKGTPFVKPAGVISSGSCSADDGLSCEGFGSDYSIAGINVPSYVSVKAATVCVDQTNKLARPIDISLGKSTTIVIKSYKMPDPSLQSFADAYVTANADTLGALMPTEYCNINRNPSGTDIPWVIITSPISGSYVDTTNFTFSAKAYTANGTVSSMVLSEGAAVVKSYTDSANEAIDIAPGAHTFTVKVTDSNGKVGTSSFTITRGVAPTPTTSVIATPTVLPTP